MSVSMMVSGPMMGDDDVDDVGDDVLSCPGSYYCFSPTLLPTRRGLKLNCSRSHPVERDHILILPHLSLEDATARATECRSRPVA